MSAPQAEIDVGRTFIPPSDSVQARNSNGRDAGSNSVAQHACAPAAKELDHDSRQCNLNP
jgi:hypothetical protein